MSSNFNCVQMSATTIMTEQQCQKNKTYPVLCWTCPWKCLTFLQQHQHTHTHTHTCTYTRFGAAKMIANTGEYSLFVHTPAPLGVDFLTQRFYYVSLRENILVFTWKVYLYLAFYHHVSALWIFKARYNILTSTISILNTNSSVQNANQLGLINLFLDWLFYSVYHRFS